MNKTRNIMRRRIAVALAMVALAATAALAAQSIVSSSVDGGGGIVTGVQSGGATFSLAASTGQPDAGVLSGGAFTLNGGFVQPEDAYPRAAVQSPWWQY